ncbi:hypothetical protein Pelo_8094 [Pelomyxa schiedti]|nr:hypothetical protein Pelo_8094 [Pelomyxa schiedti]
MAMSSTTAVTTSSTESTPSFSQEEVTAILVREICAAKPPCRDIFVVDFFNILLFGKFGAGKSSTANTLASAFSHSVRELAPTAPSTAAHESRDFCPYQLFNDTDFKPRLRIWDTWGLDSSNYRREELDYMLNGNMTAYTRDNDDPQSHLLDARDPRIAQQRIHCVIFIISASEIPNPSALNQAKPTLFDNPGRLGIPSIFIVTHCDTLDERVASSPQLIGTSTLIQEKLDHLSRVWNLPRRDIFPVVNYTTTTKNSELEVWPLLALRRAIQKASDMIMVCKNQYLRSGEYLFYGPVHTVACLEQP